MEHPILNKLTAFACGMVLGNPSRMKPFLHSGFSKLAEISSTTRSSLTKAPEMKKKIAIEVGNLNFKKPSFPRHFAGIDIGILPLTII